MTPLKTNLMRSLWSDSRRGIPFYYSKARAISATIQNVFNLLSSSVWTGSTPPGKFVIFLVSSTSSCCSTVLFCGSRPPGPSSSLNSTQAICVSEKIAPLSKVMDSQALGQRMDSEMEISDSENLQRMFIRLCALNSTVSYALETLIQHRTLIGQLHDEVNTLRS
jgi:hypothetical protein